MKDKKKIEEAVEEIVEKKKINIGKVFLDTLFVLLTLIAIFFMATYIRWKAEISDKYPVIYRGQEQVKVDKLVDFYGIEVPVELKEDETILMYCTSEYGKECIMPNYSSVLENNFREPLLAISIIVFIDLVLIYFLLKDTLNGKKRTYIYGAVILLYGLFILGRAVYKVADYYKEIKFNKTVEGEVVGYLRSDYKDKFIPVVEYIVEDNRIKDETAEQEEQTPPTVAILTDYTIKGDFKKDKITLYYEGNYELITPKKSMRKYILPAITGLAIVVMGFIYLTITKRFKKKELKAQKDKK